MANSFWGCGISDVSVATDFVHITSRRGLSWKTVTVVMAAAVEVVAVVWRRLCP